MNEPSTAAEMYALKKLVVSYIQQGFLLAEGGSPSLKLYFCYHAIPLLHRTNGRLAAASGGIIGLKGKGHPDALLLRALVHTFAGLASHIVPLFVTPLFSVVSLSPPSSFLHEANEVIMIDRHSLLPLLR